MESAIPRELLGKIENLNSKERGGAKHENDWKRSPCTLLVSAAYAAEDVVSAVHGAIKKIDAATKIIVVKTADGTEHTMHFLDKTTVHGVDASAAAAKDSWHGLKEGTEVVAHYTTKGNRRHGCGDRQSGQGRPEDDGWHDQGH